MFDVRACSHEEEDHGQLTPHKCHGNFVCLGLLGPRVDESVTVSDLGIIVEHVSRMLPFF